jgi:hypothetical protein
MVDVMSIHTRVESSIEPVGHSARGGRDSPKKVVTNERDYRSLEREYVISRLSTREICRNHGISAHRSVVVQAKKEGWQEKRRAYQARASESDTGVPWRHDGYELNRVIIAWDLRDESRALLMAFRALRQATTLDEVRAEAGGIAHARGIRLTWTTRARRGRPGRPPHHHRRRSRVTPDRPDRPSRGRELRVRHHERLSGTYTQVGRRLRAATGLASDAKGLRLVL